MPADLAPNDPRMQTASARDPDTPPPADPKDAILQLARDRFKLVLQAEAALRDRMLADLRFVSGEQWPEDIKQRRYLDGRPCLTINRLSQPVKQVVNAARQSRPAVQVNPIDAGADVDTAEVFQGIIRHIETTSDADVAYATAVQAQVEMGRGYWRILTEYAADDGFEQVIRIKRVRNQFSIYYDPTCQEADYSDARFAFEVVSIPKPEFWARYGKDTGYGSLEEFLSVGNQVPDWMPEGRVLVALYWWVEVETKKRHLLADGAQLDEADYRNVRAALGEATPAIRATRPMEIRTVKWAKVTGAAVLETGDWAGKYIPIVPLLGDEHDINGEVDLRGLVRDSIDPQRMKNYWSTAITEAIALAPRAPFVMAEGQDEGYEDQWKQANTRNFTRLIYKPITLAGTVVPPPQRNLAEPPIQAMTVAMNQAEQDLRATTGYFDVQSRETRPQTEVSGRAILARQKQSELGQSNYLDNLARAIRYTGRILVDLIPKIYDTPRVLRILGLDEQPRTVMVQAAQAPAGGTLPPGVDRIYSLGVGRYDVALSVGPSHQSAKQEALETLTALIQAYPAMAPLIGDLLAGSLDSPIARQVAERLKKALPPQLREPEQGGPPPIPPEAQQQMQQMGQLIDALTQQLNQVSQELQTNVAVKKLELDSKERIASMQVRADLVATEAKINAQNAQALLKAQIEEIDHKLDLLQESRLAEEAHAHEADLQTADHAHDLAVADTVSSRADAGAKPADQSAPKTA